MSPGYARYELMPPGLHPPEKLFLIYFWMASHPAYVIHIKIYLCPVHKYVGYLFQCAVERRLERVEFIWNYLPTLYGNYSAIYDCVACAKKYATVPNVTHTISTRTEMIGSVAEDLISFRISSDLNPIRFRTVGIERISKSA